ncbi:transcription initiation at TATA-containing promoter protein [Exophiala xenobiotica]|nr:transcription initiation at TATA-containing promoter protein [Exophiala xenobiotica]KAK5299913.1 transcription initiation at TATA-containing promoter protein [Exophiala xenobiotica]KAK5324091.1 transcription initiation at TATA-containing promoter protein [Exophiala xenobiotica]KAK5411109.1 transcription initiation at TATA-containing promoter protein [Exophiala xenobiotica]KAK5499245.1 transcription initiation at TATA-containing promoter protein [Exophiala xenobiotica]
MDGYCIKCHLVIPDIQGEYCFKCGNRLFVRSPENQIGTGTNLAAVRTSASVDVGPPTGGKDYTNLPRATDTHDAPSLEPQSTSIRNYSPVQNRLSEVDNDDTILVRHRIAPDWTKADIDSRLGTRDIEDIQPKEPGQRDCKDSKQSDDKQHQTKAAVKRPTSLDYTFVDVNQIPRSRDDRSRSPTRLGSEELGSRPRDYPRPSSTASLYLDSSARASSTPLASSKETSSDDTITPKRLTHMKRVISNLKKSNFSEHFRAPVDYVALDLPSYPKIIKTPIDLGTIDRKLKDKRYSTVAEFVADFYLIINNCVRFNGPEHGITQTARRMQAGFQNQMRKLPPATNH